MSRIGSTGLRGRVVSAATISGFRRFRLLCLAAAGLLFIQSGAAKAAVFLTVNGADTGYIMLEEGQSCTIEIVSTDNSLYDALIGFEYDPLGSFQHIETKPEAGTDPWVEPWNEWPLSYGYLVGTGFGPSPGVHFVFMYHAEGTGEEMLGLWDWDGNLVDAVPIRIIWIPPEGPAVIRSLAIAILPLGSGIAITLGWVPAPIVVRA